MASLISDYINIRALNITKNKERLFHNDKPSQFSKRT